MSEFRASKILMNKRESVLIGFTHKKCPQLHSRLDRPVASVVDMDQGEDTRQQQVAILASKSLYDRLDKKLKDLEVDPFFYNKQCKLFVWRWRVLKENTNLGVDKLSFLSSQCFDEIVKNLDDKWPH